MRVRRISNFLGFLVAVRSMPGMLSSILNIGICNETLGDPLRMTGNPRFVWDSYRRLIETCAEVVYGSFPDPFRTVLDPHLKSFGVDVLGTLSEKLKQLTNEAKDHHNSFIELTKLYKGEKINEKDFFSKILNYVVTTSALTFLMVRVILEMRSALEKGTTIKD